MKLGIDRVWTSGYCGGNLLIKLKVIMGNSGAESSTEGRNSLASYRKQHITNEDGESYKFEEIQLDDIAVGDMLILVKGDAGENSQSLATVRGFNGDVIAFAGGSVLSIDKKKSTFTIDCYPTVSEGSLPREISQDDIDEFDLIIQRRVK